MKQNYKIRLVKGSIEFEAEGDENFVTKMFERFQGESSEEQHLDLKSHKTKNKPESIQIKQAPSLLTNKSLSVGEFVRKTSLKKHTDLVLAFGYYLEKYQGVKEFLPSDLNLCYYDAKMESSNTSQMIIQNIRRGYMMEAKAQKGKGKKKYTLTQTGEDFVIQAFKAAGV